MLTYAALPDPHPRQPGALPGALDAAATAAGPLTPSPPRVDLAAVAVHACRHLVLLAAVDNDVALAARAQPGLWEPITKLTPGTAGSLRPVHLT